MNVGDICEREVVTVRDFDELSGAAELMRERHVGSLVVVAPGLEEGTLQPIGMITDRDIVVAVVAGAADLKSLRVGDVMSGNLCVAREDESIEEALGEMRKVGVRRLPVVGADGNLVGILSLDDVLDHLVNQLQEVATSIRTERVIESVYRP